MKWLNSFLSVFLAAALLFTGCASAGTSETQTAPSITEEAPDDTDPKMRFTDNEVLILIEPEYNFDAYTVEDFSEINCIALRELSGRVHEGQLGRIILLTLGVHSKEYVLIAVELLEQRDDIHTADPNYLFDYELDSYSAANEYDEQWASEHNL